MSLEITTESDDTPYTFPFLICSTTNLSSIEQRSSCNKSITVLNKYIIGNNNPSWRFYPWERLKLQFHKLTNQFYLTCLLITANIEIIFSRNTTKKQPYFHHNRLLHKSKNRFNRIHYTRKKTIRKKPNSKPTKLLTRTI
jgi:hypothetical protein